MSQRAIPAGMPIGLCPDCGPVHGDDLEYNFPNPGHCRCGAILERELVSAQTEIITR